MKRLFFDADVILDVSIKRELDIRASIEIIRLAEQGVYKGFTSSLVFSNVYYIQRKIIGHVNAINFLKNKKCS